MRIHVVGEQLLSVLSLRRSLSRNMYIQCHETDVFHGGVSIVGARVKKAFSSFDFRVESKNYNFDLAKRLRISFINKLL